MFKTEIKKHHLVRVKPNIIQVKSFKTADLEWYGAHLRKNHEQGTKTNIRFDEENLSLDMSIALPGQDEWLRVTPDMAKQEN